MLSHGLSLEFPMNVLKFDRTEIDHIAKISTMDGIQQLKVVVCQYLSTLHCVCWWSKMQ